MKMTKHRQHKSVSMNKRGFLRIGGMVIPYYPAYMWGGIGSGTTNADTTTTDGAGNGNTGADSGSGADGGGSL